MSKDKHKPRARGLGHFGRFILVGFFTVAPLWVTWVVFDFVIGMLARAGRPLLHAAARGVRGFSPAMASWMLESGFERIVAFLIVLFALYGVGVFATFLIGRQLISWFEALMDRLPFVQTVYGGTRRLLQSLRTPPAAGQRVALIPFPNERMKTVGMVMRTLRDSDTGGELAVVYVPTAPNPTSGYIEIVPIKEIVFVEWSIEEAMTFVMTGGATSPDSVRFSNGGEPAAGSGEPAPGSDDPMPDGADRAPDSDASDPPPGDDFQQAPGTRQG